MARVLVYVFRTADVAGVASELTDRGFILMPERHGSGPQHYSITLEGALVEIYPAVGERASDVAPEKWSITVQRRFAVRAWTSFSFYESHELLGRLPRDHSGLAHQCVDLCECRFLNGLSPRSTYGRLLR